METGPAVQKCFQYIFPSAEKSLVGCDHNKGVRLSKNDMCPVVGCVAGRWAQLKTLDQDI